ncbi:hypothetical protein M1N85_05350 [Dehalococcoidia bacterium]|nr:hypothetical protein [Dehalococcoidia bacterium]
MKGRVFSGARPTGRQHIGNYLGAIQNYVKLQEEHECIYCIVDIHALISMEDVTQMQGNILHQRGPPELLIAGLTQAQIIAVVIFLIAISLLIARWRKSQECPTENASVS